MPEIEYIDLDVVLDVICEWLEIHLDFHGEVIDDYPVMMENVELAVANPEVRAILAKHMSEAQAEGRAVLAPSAQELTAARERLLALRQSTPPAGA